MSVASWFLADARTARDRAAPAAPAVTAGRIAVLLESGRNGRGLGAVLGLALAREARVPTVLVLGWRTRRPAGGGLPSTPAVRRLVRALRARDLEARSAGRIVHVDLPDDDGDAATAASRAVAAAPGETPVVIALGGPRGAALDALLTGADVVVVTGGPDDPCAQAALDGVASAGTRAVAWADPPGGPWRRLAWVGLGAGLASGLPVEARR